MLQVSFDKNKNTQLELLAGKGRKLLLVEGRTRMISDLHFVG
jgi:hypothetical protein